MEQSKLVTDRNTPHNIGEKYSQPLTPDECDCMGNEFNWESPKTAPITGYSLYLPENLNKKSLFETFSDYLKNKESKMTSNLKMCFGSPKSKEGCRVTPKQAKKLSALMMRTFNYQKPVKLYCMIKRLILRVA